MTPEDLHPADRRRQRRRRDAAYASFLYLGWMLAAAYALHWLPVTLPGYRLLAEFLTTPALVLAVPAVLVAAVATVMVWHEPYLWMLAAGVAAVWPVLWICARWPAAATGPAGIFFAVLTLLLCALPLNWFSISRRSWNRALPGEPEAESERPW